MMRLLRLVTVRNVLESLRPDVAACGREPLPIDTSMREVLTRLLQADCDALPVVDGDGQPVGQVTLEAVRQQLRRSDAYETENQN